MAMGPFPSRVMAWMARSYPWPSPIALAKMAGLEVIPRRPSTSIISASRPLAMRSLRM